MPRTLLGDKKIIRTIFEALSVKRTLPPHLDFTMTKAQAKPILLPPIYDVSAAPTPSNPTGNINKGLLLPSEWGSTGICADSNGHILLRFVHRNLPTPFRLHLRCHPSWQSVLFWPLKGREDTTVLIVRVALDLFRVSMPMGRLILYQPLGRRCWKKCSPEANSEQYSSRHHSTSSEYCRWFCNETVSNFHQPCSLSAVLSRHNCGRCLDNCGK